jgi:hypothetical protein
MILILVVYDVNCKCRYLKKARSKKTEKKRIFVGMYFEGH